MKASGREIKTNTEMRGANGGWGRGRGGRREENPERQRKGEVGERQMGERCGEQGRWRERWGDGREGQRQRDKGPRGMERDERGRLSGGERPIYGGQGAGTERCERVEEKAETNGWVREPEIAEMGKET